LGALAQGLDIDGNTTGGDYSRDVMARARTLKAILREDEAKDLPLPAQTGGRYSVKDHFLCLDGQRVEYRQSPNHGRIITPRLIVIHYTGDNSLQGALSWLCAPSAQVSAHLVVGKDGKVYQLVPFNVAAWHAGVSSYNGQPGVNGFSIGIENVGIGDFWPDAQVEANRAIIAALSEAYAIEDIVGHCDVAPGRKADPGPNYPWDKICDLKAWIVWQTQSKGGLSHEP
jgi:N-acetylmuramoyl-L-alanine amidase